MTFQICHTVKLQFIINTVTCENSDCIQKNLNFKTLFWFLVSGFVFVLTVSFFSSDFYLFLNVISQPVNSRYIGLNLEGKYNHIRVNTKKRLEFKTNMSLDAIRIQSGINSFIFLEMDTQKQIVNIFGYLPTICLVSSFSPMSENASQNGRYISRVTVTSDAFASELKSSILQQKICN